MPDEEVPARVPNPGSYPGSNLCRAVDGLDRMVDIPVFRAASGLRQQGVV